MNLQQRQFEWEITLVDNSIKRESEQRFDLSWFDKGKVKKFILKEIGGDAQYGVDLETGAFKEPEKPWVIESDMDSSIITNTKQVSLIYFKRNFVQNTVTHDDNGKITDIKTGDARRLYFFGYKKGKIERLMCIGPNVHGEFEAKFAQR